ncbi:MAG: hypothetical protein J6X89_07745 [Bacteroidales bacterium]|nr:hypothetical protein [Bacteroidales bacterium]
MKSLRFALGLTLSLIVAACAQYDDEWIKQGFADLQQRMTTLETRVNSDISSLSGVVTALQEKNFVVSCVPYSENGVQVGWQLNFAKGDPVIIHFGKDGANGQDGHSPKVGVKQDTDGVWYWTLDGEWLLNEAGAKVQAIGTDGKNGLTPRFKIDGTEWYVSMDDGQTWTPAGKATGDNGKDGDSFFKSVTEDENYVYLTLADETVIRIPKATILAITFNPSESISIKPGEETDVTYKVTSAFTPVKVQVVTSFDIRAKVTPASEDGLSGTITLADFGMHDEFSQIVVIVDNGQKVLTQAFNMENGGLQGYTGKINGYEWVDLGLPSGIKWASCNVGANQPEEFGDYFAWGDPLPYYIDWKLNKWREGKETGYNNANYKWYKLNEGYYLTKYCIGSQDGIVDNKTVLEPEDDAACVNWGGSWRTPTADELTELKDCCAWIYGEQNGVHGMWVYGPNGQSIFFPAADYFYWGGPYGHDDVGCYWSSSVDEYDLVVYLGFSPNYVEILSGSRTEGSPVRAVTE